MNFSSISFTISNKIQRKRIRVWILINYFQISLISFSNKINPNDMCGQIYEFESLYKTKKLLKLLILSDWRLVDRIDFNMAPKSTRNSSVVIVPRRLEKSWVLSDDSKECVDWKGERSRHWGRDNLFAIYLFSFANIESENKIIN